MRIILASQSPSRRAVLAAAGIAPLVRPSAVDEDAVRAQLPATAAPNTVVEALACAKAEALGAQPDAVTIGCDSMLLSAQGALQGKPHTVETTIARWKQQAGTTATLLTGHCLIAPDGSRYTEVTSTTVHFAQAHDEDIAAYAATGEPLGCAGAFTLEALGGWFIDRIEGDPSSVIGISLPALRRGLYSFGFSVHDFWAQPTTAGRDH
ncbi:Maf-like protein [Corynebacterium uberis]|uniref:Maf family protein n=1 Tax=Corynebacterium TaxID=1716 RepID=UPI001D0A9BB2|nr:MULTISPECIES: nucleoside triphosphate pyrophosphatase [Corynebacterium]MCZ9309254.1 Maf-like protein [Corynebacterium sp. c6VSa_13]UDL76314.1 Maf-like protein [Corynebacterium uberis]UDL78526.1 Maf-like protein [Corynebacterium uberis]UDL80807.1 Maf-like protein [Corynebacterium uberis]UDL85150.1 Maf-like protein [Corynebacterium uberis]